MTPQWRKSSRSGVTDPRMDCVEVARLANDIGVRDSKDPGGPALRFSAADWRTFTHRVKRSDHDLV